MELTNPTIQPGLVDFAAGKPLSHRIDVGTNQDFILGYSSNTILTIENDYHPTDRTGDQVAFPTQRHGKREQEFPRLGPARRRQAR
jgi:hypothetical protein